MIYPYEVDIAIGKILGRENSCIGKRCYKTVALVLNAKNSHNKLAETHSNFHKVHAYVCGFCGCYHTGRQWHKDDIKLLFRSHLTKEEQEFMIPMVDAWWKSELRHHEERRSY